MNNEIKNEKSNVPTGKNMNDKDYINSLLSSLKDMCKNYSIALTEASNETLYNKYKSMYDTYSKLQRDVFELMFRKGWYVLESSPTDKINNKFNNLKQEFNDLSE